MHFQGRSDERATVGSLCKLLEGVKSRSHIATQEEGSLSSLFSNEIHVKAFGTQDMSLLLPFQEVTADGDEWAAISVQNKDQRGLESNPVPEPGL